MNKNNKPAFIIDESDVSFQQNDTQRYLIEGKSKKEGSTKQPFRLYSDPKSISDLLQIENMKEILENSFIFIQNKKDSSNQLLFNKLSCFSHYYDFIDVEELNFRRGIQIGNNRNLFDNLLLKDESRPLAAKKNILVIETRGSAETKKLCDEIYKSRGKRYGIWVCGYIWDLSPYTISLFDALFAFDMSVKEYEVLKSAIDLSDELIEDLKSHSQKENMKGKTLFFLNRDRVVDGPLLIHNPVLFHQ